MFKILQKVVFSLVDSTSFVERGRVKMRSTHQEIIVLFTQSPMPHTLGQNQQERKFKKAKVKFLKIRKVSHVSAFLVLLGLLEDSFSITLFLDLGARDLRLASMDSLNQSFVAYCLNLEN